MSAREMLKPWFSWLPHGIKQGAEYRAWSRFLADAERWPRERIEQWQTERLRAVIRHAVQHTEGYRELYRKAGVGAEDIQSPRDVRVLPCVTKEMLRDNLAAFTAPTPGASYATTGGSTGIPFGFYGTHADGRRENAFMHAGWRRAGWNPELHTAVLRGAFVGSKEELWQHDRFWDTLLLTSYYLTAQTLPTYLDMLARHRIDILHAYPSSFLLFCDLVKESGRAPASAPRLALLGSENLYDWQMARFAEVFPQTRIFSWYGHAEKVVLAPWCEHSRRLHVWPFYGLAEVLDEKGEPVVEGGEGEIVGTSLHLRATPFIRYRTMDMAVKGPEQCPDCGRQFSTLERIMGRLQEVIVTRTGRYISMTAINFHDGIFDRLRQFQFRQEIAGELAFHYVPKAPLSSAEEQGIRDGLMKKLGTDMALHMHATDRIELTARGKLRFLDQRLSIKYGDR